MLPHDRNGCGRAGPLRAGDRAGDARRARHRVEDVLRLRDRVRRRAEHPDLPGVSRPAGRAAGRQRGRDRVDDPDRTGAELLDRHLVPVRAQELLLPGHAEELPDLAVRRAAVRRRLPRRRGRRAVPTGSVSSGCTSRRTPARTRTSGQTGRIHGADYSLVDFNRAGIPLVEIVTKPVPGTGACAPEVARAYVTELRDILRTLGVSDVRMEQGSLRCDVNTSLNAPGAPVGHPHRDQERQLAAQRRAGGALGDAPAGGRPGRRTPGRAGDAALLRDDRRHPPRPQQGGGDRLPLLPRARPRSDGAGPRLGGAVARRAAGAARSPSGPDPESPRRECRGHAADDQRRGRRPGRRNRRGRSAGRPRRGTGGWATSPRRPTSARSNPPIWR